MPTPVSRRRRTKARPLRAAWVVAALACAPPASQPDAGRSVVPFGAEYGFEGMDACPQLVPPDGRVAVTAPAAAEVEQPGTTTTRFVVTESYATYYAATGPDAGLVTVRWSSDVPTPRVPVVGDAIVVTTTRCQVGENGVAAGHRVSDADGALLVELSTQECTDVLAYIAEPSGPTCFQPAPAAEWCCATSTPQRLSFALDEPTTIDSGGSAEGALDGAPVSVGGVAYFVDEGAGADFGGPSASGFVLSIAP